MEDEIERIKAEVEEATSDPAAQQEWIRQSNLTYGGLGAAGLVVVQPEEYRHQVTRSRLVSFAKAVAQGSAFVGIAAAFWHISAVAGIVFVLAAFFALGVHSSGYMQLEYDGTFRSRFPRRKP